MGNLVVGVLALQGAFARHIHVLQELGVKAVEIRKPQELASCNALIIPGGESTTMMKQMQFIGFPSALRDFTEKKPVFGTCAGLILMSHEIAADEMRPFDMLDIIVERNAFGRQVESFYTEVDVVAERLLEKKKPHKVAAMFIRAPRILQVGKEVQVLATYQGEPVLVQQGRHLGATFHPELTSDISIHAYFLKMCR